MARSLLARNVKIALTRAAVASCLLTAQHGFASCSYEFTWTCSNCGRIGGLTSGTEGPYSSQSNCERARSQVHSDVSANSCQPRSACVAGEHETGEMGNVEADIQPNKTGRSASATAGDKQRAAAFLSTWENGISTSEPAGNQEKVEAARQRILNLIDPATPDLKDSYTQQHPVLLQSQEPDNPKIAPPPSFDSTPVLQGRVVDPTFFKRPLASFKSIEVPSPYAPAKNSEQYYLAASETLLIMDAMKAGGGQLNHSIAYLENLVIIHDQDLASKEFPATEIAYRAISFLEGIDHMHKRTGGEEQYPPAQDSTTIEDTITSMITGSTEEWPGEKRSSSDTPLSNPLDWRIRRNQEIYQFLEENKRAGDPEDPMAWGYAIYFLRGVEAYADYLEEYGQD